MRCQTAGPSRDDQIGSFGQIYEDTEFVGGAKQRSREQTEQFAMYEDTEFLPEGESGKAESKAAGRSARRPPRMPERESKAEDRAKTDDFGVYQVLLLTLGIVCLHTSCMLGLQVTWVPSSQSMAMLHLRLQIAYFQAGDDNRLCITSQ